MRQSIREKLERQHRIQFNHIFGHIVKGNDIIKELVERVNELKIMAKGLAQVIEREWPKDQADEVLKEYRRLIPNENTTTDTDRV